jgi:hypothetical protein
MNKKTYRLLNEIGYVLRSSYNELSTYERTKPTDECVYEVMMNMKDLNKLVKQLKKEIK